MAYTPRWALAAAVPIPINCNGEEICADVFLWIPGAVGGLTTCGCQAAGAKLLVKGTEYIADFTGHT